MKKQKITSILLVILAIVGLISAHFIHPIAQDKHYHSFCDQRCIYGVPNFWNVLSNLPFLLVGIIGLIKLRSISKESFISENKIAYQFFYLGITFVSIGSGYYHLSPSNESLLWDRLPMTFAFMGLFSILISEFISVKSGKLLLFPLLVSGVFSVLYWFYTEKIQMGNLNYYILVQFYPVISIPIILLFYPSKLTHFRAYWYLLLAYLLAKISEHFDEAIFTSIHLLSGHSIKHILTSLGLMGVVLVLHKRQKKSA